MEKRQDWSVSSHMREQLRLPMAWVSNLDCKLFKSSCVMFTLFTTHMLTKSQISGTDRQGREAKRGDGPCYH
jgi:hypothetical protein